MASKSPSYSLNPNTSNLVFMTIKGFESVVYKALANAEEVKLTACSDIKFIDRSIY